MHCEKVAADTDFSHPGAFSVLDDFWGDFGNEQTENASGSMDETVCFKEMEAYLAEPLQPLTNPIIDPTEYWHLNQHKYPVLADCARKFLATPASSVESERIFSSASDICDDKRLSLTPFKLEQLLFLIIITIIIIINNHCCSHVFSNQSMLF